MIGTRYVVKKGDCLWKIARLKLGHGTEWKRLWEFNNSPQVLRLTRQPIPNPDLIYPDQLLLLPLLHGQAEQCPRGPENPPSLGVRSSHADHENALRATSPLADRVAKDLSPLAFKYALREIHMPSIVTPAYKAEFQLEGEITLVANKASSPAS
jgi:hypothetical protein